MRPINRRDLLSASAALALPGGLTSVCGAWQSPADLIEDVKSANSASRVESVQQQDVFSDRKPMQLHYLEIVTPAVDAVCAQYEKVFGVTFGDRDENLGGARTTQLPSGGMLGIRGPLRENEAPVVRPYLLVEDIKKAVAAAAEAGAEVALPSMELPGHGTCAIVVQGGIDFGFWQL